MLVRASPAIIPLFDMPVPAGFPSPAADFSEQAIDLSELLIRNKPATFLMRASGESMIEAGILDGALLVIDRSEHPRDNDIVVATLNGEHVVKHLRRRGRRAWLEAANPAYPEISIGDDADFKIFGVVMHIINSRR